MLWPFWSKDWGPEFSIAQPKVTAYLKSNHILSFITCSSDQTPNPKSKDSDKFFKNAVCMICSKRIFVCNQKKKDTNEYFLPKKLIYSSMKICKLIFCKKNPKTRIEFLMISRDNTKTTKDLAKYCGNDTAVFKFSPFFYSFENLVILSFENGRASDYLFCQ